MNFQKTNNHDESITRAGQRFCFYNDSSDSSDSEATFPPPASGLSQKKNTRKFVLDDVSDQDSTSEYTTAREDNDVDVGFDRLAISSPQSRATNAKNAFMASPSTLSVAQKLCAGGIPHVVNARRDSTGVSSLEQVVMTSDDESHLDTPPPERESSLDYFSKALVDTDKEEEEKEDDASDDDDSRSTVVQEGRTKTPKRRARQIFEEETTTTVRNLLSMKVNLLYMTTWEEKYFELESSSSIRETFTDCNSQPLVYDTQDDATTVLNVETPVKRQFSLGEESQALVDSSQDDTTTCSYVQSPVKREPSIYDESQALVDSSPDDTQIATPQREPSLCEESQALVDSSPDDDTTVLYIATPKQEPSLCEESQILVDSSPDDTTTVLNAETPVKQEPSLSDQSEALVDSSPDDTSTVLNVPTPVKQEPSLSDQSEALVDSSPDDTSTVLNVPTPVKQEPLSSSNDSREDSKSTIYPPETPWKDDVNQSMDNSTEDPFDLFTTIASKGSPVSAPKYGGSARQHSDSLLDSSSDESDSSTLYPAESPERESCLDGISSMLADTHLDNISRCFEDDDGREEVDGKSLSDTSPFEQKNEKNGLSR